MKCKYCGEDNVLGAVRCMRCGRLLPMSAAERRDLMMGKGNFAVHEEMLSDSDRKMLHSWENARKEAEERMQESMRSWGQRTLNVFIGALILVVVSLLGLYLLVTVAPELGEELGRVVMQKPDLRGDAKQVFGSY